MVTRKEFLKTMAAAAASAVLPASAWSAAAEKETVKRKPGGKLLAGVAKKKITPSAEQLSAYQKLDARFNGEIDQDLFARIIVLGNEQGDKLLLVSTDLRAVPFYNELIGAISSKHGIPKSACILSGTQNQQALILETQGPVVAKIAKDMMATILAGVGEALATMQPAQMALEKGTSDINVHFGRPTPVGYLAMPDFGKFADKELSVLRIDDLSGKTLALYVNYGVQSNMMLDGSGKLSGDLAGHVSEFIERRLNCVCAYAVGAAAEAYPLTTATLSNPVFDTNGKVTLEVQKLSEQATTRLRDYLTSVQGMDILNLYDKMTRFSKVFSVRTGEQTQTAAGKKGNIVHRLHLVVVNEDIAFAGANSIASARLGKLVKESLPYRTLFVASEGKVLGYVVDQETAIEGIAGKNCVAADAWESEKIYVRGFNKLAQTI